MCSTPRCAAIVLLFLAVVGLVVGAASTAEAGRPRIVNGLYTSEYPTTGALLKGVDADSAGAHCSGTMIGCSTFLTAAHCVCDGVGADCQPGDPGEPNPGEYFVFLQHAGVFSVDSISVHTAYDFPTADVAVVKLSVPVAGIRPTPLQLSGSPAFGTAGTIVGFGRSGDGNDDYLLKRVGNVETADCAPDSNAALVCWSYQDPVGPPGTDSNTCEGDSGGPLFIAGPCGTVIAGITSGGSSAECTPLDSSYDANVYTYRAFIQAEAGADLSNVACGAMPQIGEAGTTIDGLDDSLSAADPDDVHGFTLPVGLQEARFSMNAVDEGGADFDLYVKAGAPPTTSDYDCRADGSGQTGFCGFSSPAAGDWYAMVRRAAGSGKYQVTVTTIEPGSPGTGGGGACDDGNACTIDDTCVASACVGSTAPDGSLCDDGTRCTDGDACSAGVCAGAAAPLSGCFVPAVARGSSITIKASTTDPGRDSLSWRWGRGSSSPGDLGNPVASTAYELCVFDHAGGVPTVASRAQLPPGALWKATPRGFRYTDKAALHGGVKSLSLATSVTNRTSISVNARGATLMTPSLPLQQDPSVVVQLSNGSACWEAGFGVSSRNDAATFRARSD